MDSKQVIQITDSMDAAVRQLGRVDSKQVVRVINDWAGVLDEMSIATKQLERTLVEFHKEIRRFNINRLQRYYFAEKLMRCLPRRVAWEISVRVPIWCVPNKDKIEAMIVLEEL